MSRERGKKRIDTWTVTKDGRTVDVAVSMIRETEQGERGGSSTPVFMAECEELNLRERGTDIGELHKSITADITKLLSVTYSPHYVIEVSGFSRPSTLEMYSRGSYNDNRAEVKINVTRLLLSDEPTADGRKLFKRDTASAPRPYTAKLGRLTDLHQPNIRALIPDKPGTLEGLTRIFEAFEDLNKRLADLCDVDVIENNLALLAAPGGRLLPAGEPSEN